MAFDKLVFNVDKKLLNQWTTASKVVIYASYILCNI